MPSLIPSSPRRRRERERERERDVLLLAAGPDCDRKDSSMQHVYVHQCPPVKATCSVVLGCVCLFPGDSSSNLKALSVL